MFKSQRLLAGLLRKPDAALLHHAEAFLSASVSPKVVVSITSPLELLRGLGASEVSEVEP